ncbi:RNA 2',3'-cyclic phosphodiesterase [soil metagenome]
MIRAFVGLPLPDDIASRLVAAQAGLPAGRPVAFGNLHRAFAFLGEHPAPGLEDFHHALDAFRLPAFALTLAGLGLFGGARPRVLYAEARPEPALTRLRDKTLQAARSAGIRLERERFHAHVTLARLNAALTPEEAEKLRAFAARGAGLRAGPFTAARFVLFRSRLCREHPSYEEMASYPLEGAVWG